MKKVIIIILILLLILIGIIYFFDNRNIDLFNNSSEEIVLTKSIKITKSGTYKLTGIIDDGYIEINTDGNIKLILNNVSITNSKGPAIYIKEAKKVEINTLKGTTNNLTDGKQYQDFDDINGCIYSHDNLILSGNGKLVITANYENGIVSNDSLKILSGDYLMNAQKNAIKVNDDIEIDDGNFNIDANNDGIHTASNLIINDGNFKINCIDDAIHAEEKIEINDGNFVITGAEGIEATYIKINDGAFVINALDDGINAGKKSKKYTPTIEINDGNIVIKMAEGDTDGIDSNGNLYINGGTINVTAKSPFDYDGEVKYTGGTIIVNGKETNTITNQIIGGGIPSKEVRKQN